MIKLVKKTEDGLKVEVGHRYFWLDNHPQGIQVNILAYENKYKRVFQTLGVFKTHKDCVVYLKQYVR